MSRQSPRAATERKLFGWEHKRLCGFVFLRTPRTGSRALSLRRGSLLDTVLRLGGTGLADMCQDTLNRLQGLAPPIGQVPQLKQIRKDRAKGPHDLMSSRFFDLLRMAEARLKIKAFFDFCRTRQRSPKPAGPL